VTEGSDGRTEPGRAGQEIVHLLEAALSPVEPREGLDDELEERLSQVRAAALEELSRRSRIPLSRIYGVVSFYAQFYTAPRGRHTVRCCSGTACHVKGAERILDAVRRTLGIEEGQTTGDMEFCLETVACLGTCFLAPVMMIDDQYYGDLDAQQVDTILSTFGEDGS